MRYFIQPVLVVILLVWTLGGCDSAKADIVKGNNWISASKHLRRAPPVLPLITTRYLSLTIRPGVQRVLYTTTIYDPRTRLRYTRGRILQ